MSILTEHKTLFGIELYHCPYCNGEHFENDIHECFEKKVSLRIEKLEERIAELEKKDE